MGPPAELQAMETMSLPAVEPEVGVGETLGMLLFRFRAPRGIADSIDAGVDSASAGRGTPGPATSARWQDERPSSVPRSDPEIGAAETHL